ncbi:MAG: L-rhamnose isomerase [Clostridiales bacterium]|nr:L-rhamnose isomerase [Clostridiales bacterium]
MNEKLIQAGYDYARQVYAAQGVDVDAAMEKCAKIAISMHCWQGDDVVGCEGAGGGASGGIATTGNYPGRARCADELRADAEKAISLIPGAKKFSLHASYAELSGKKLDRDAYTAEQFSRWIDWAKGLDMGLDFNPTYFSHPYAEGGFTLASSDAKIRDFWVEHGLRCREIGLAFAKALGKPCYINFWMPDGYKDSPADTEAPRVRMLESLDRIFAAHDLDSDMVRDAVESKLFGLGVESYTVGSHELMLGYAITRGKLYTLDAGHFHPTEVISAKLSAVLQFLPEVMLHVSRGVRWDSDHVIALDDELQNIMLEIVRGGYEKRVAIGLDYFDASINRVAAWVIGVRNAQKALLKALLEPTAAIRAAEAAGDYTARLALLEEAKTLPFAAVWDAYCLKQNVPAGDMWLPAVKQYERDVLSQR